MVFKAAELLRQYPLLYIIDIKQTQLQCTCKGKSRINGGNNRLKILLQWIMHEYVNFY